MLDYILSLTVHALHNAYREVVLFPLYLLICATD